MNENGLRLLMHAGEEAPPSRVDLGRVVADGNHRRARQRAAAGVAAAVAVLAVTGTAALGLRSAPGTADGPPAGPPAAAASASPAHRTAGGFDPILLLRIAPGWLPDGVREDPDPLLWAAVQSVSYTDDGGKFDATDLTITLYANGFMPRWLDPATAGDPNQLAVSTSAAPALGSGDASWYTVETHRAPGDTHVRPDRNGLLWQWAPGSYATVEGEAPGTLAENRAMWRHIAATLGTAGRRPFAAGVRVAVPAPLVLIGVDRITEGPGPGGGTTVLILSDKAYVPPPGHAGRGYRVMVGPDGVHVNGRETEGLEPLGADFTASVRRLPDPADWTLDPSR
ncbi:hypothetical protein [Dactylosporangium sp. CA-139066]|uniref:hypothetical protein n=1 Tax=Dactylosporangium sp. CA-139066 TaxID=3239930 RepID=UPI003D9486CE